MAKKKRAVIAKVKSDGKTKVVKYEYVNNVPAFKKFLEKTFQDWYWMNVFDRETKRQIANFTKNNPPTYHP